MRLISINLKKLVCNRYTEICNKPRWYDEDYSVRYGYALTYSVLMRLPDTSGNTIGYITEDITEDYLLKMPQKLIKLDDYEIAWKAKAKANQLKTGIECPDCQEELQYLDPNVVLMSHPPKKAIHCTNCGFSTYITV